MHSIPSVRTLVIVWAILTFMTFATFYIAQIDLGGWKRWTFPLVVVGMNSIAIYCMSQMLKPWIRQTLRTHFGQDIFNWTYGPVVQATAIMLPCGCSATGCIGRSSSCASRSGACGSAACWSRASVVS